VDRVLDITQEEAETAMRAWPGRRGFLRRLRRWRRGRCPACRPRSRERHDRGDHLRSRRSLPLHRRVRRHLSGGDGPGSRTELPARRWQRRRRALAGAAAGRGAPVGGGRGTLRGALRVLRDSSALPGRDSRDWARESNCERAGLETAQILAELEVDRDCLIAGLLYRAVREERLKPAAIGERFGAPVERLLRGVLRMAAISDLRNPSDVDVLGQAEKQRDNIRKMLVAMVDDVRVALIKLAERTCAIRAVKNDEERRELVARDIFDVYAPLAHRLGIGHLKWELEDLSFRYLYNESYMRIARLLDGKRVERDRFIERVRAAAPRGARQCRHRVRHQRTCQAHLQYLAKDAAQGNRLLPGLRHPRRAHPGAGGQGLLRHPGSGTRPVAQHPQRIRRLHRQPQGKRLPLPAYGGDRSGGQDPRGADPHPRDARGGGARRVRPLALQGLGRLRGRAPATRKRSAGCARCSTGTRRPATRWALRSSSASR
jgi:hypothetical protein